ncbi:hypothetical protein BdWA1_002572 [Babesia duncani]|uniref:Uncharacterized protein n=1 Tax=Babesia duncani TaxID=323732 RepID=A0AAD9PJE0_9APIC|nr:hypothetical protein BdWA1_002572 [Babesia duncani]
MKVSFIYWILSVFITVCNSLLGDEPTKEPIATNDEEDTATREMLYEGFVNGMTINFDFLSLSKHNDAVEEGKEEPQTPQEHTKEHMKNVHEAKLEADYLTRHRPLESVPVPEEESDLYSMFNILMHYLASRSMKWKVVEPSEEDLIDGGEKHMVFVSDGDNNENQSIPRNMIFAVGHMQKSLPVKQGKFPIILTCLEAFIVSKLSFQVMSKLLKSSAVMEMKIQLVDRWIQMAKKHFVLYLPYVTITAQRCYDLLKGVDDTTPDSNYSETPYKHLLKNCSALIQKRVKEPDLQTFVMLDSELHSKLIKHCLKEKHIIPSILGERETHLKRIHKTIDKEMNWEVFSSAANMLLLKLEHDILENKDKWLSPATWGCDLDKKGAAEAERKLISDFMSSQINLNLKIKNTIMALNKVVSNAAKDNGKSLSDSMKDFAEKEYEAAKKEAETNKELDECMKLAGEKFLEDSKYCGSDASKSKIVNSLTNYNHDGWMGCMSSRILPMITDVCKENPQYCQSLLTQLRKQQNDLNPDSTAFLVMENLQTSIYAVLLKLGEMKPEDIQRHMSDVVQHEIEEMKEIVQLPQGSGNEVHTEASTAEIKPHK